MRKLFLILFLLGLSIYVKSQDSKAVINAAGFQAGFLGGWFYNENGIANDVTLRVEFGANMWFYDEFGRNPYFYPSLSVEPRFYYNILSRQKKGKSIDKNCADFISLKVVFVPEFAHLPQKTGYTFSNSLALVPYWGLRREIAKHVFFEFGLGAGFEFHFGNNSKENNLVIMPHLRLGM